MSKRILYVVIAVLSIIAIYGLYLVSVLRRSEKMGGNDNLPSLISTKSEPPAGEATVNVNEKSPIVPFERVNINKVWVKNSKVYYKSESGVPYVDLEIGFKNNGVDKTMTVTLVDKVLHYLFFQENGNYKTDDKQYLRQKRDEKVGLIG